MKAPDAKKKIAVTVGIPAYNESQNICNLLNSIVGQKGLNFKIDAILVANDGSADDTAVKVSAMSKKYPLIQLIGSSKRIGKKKRLAEIYRRARGEIIAIFDADVLLADEFVIKSLVEGFSSKDIVLVSGNKMPVGATNLFERLVNVWDMIWQETRGSFEDRSNVHNFCSCVFAIRRSFTLSTQRESSILSESQFWYFLAIKMQKRVAFSENAVVYFKSPDNITDYLKQINRSNEQEKIVQFFGDWVREFYYVPRHIKAKGLLRSIVKYPFWVPPALALSIASGFLPKHQDPLVKKGMWQTVNSSKTTIKI